MPLETKTEENEKGHAAWWSLLEQVGLARYHLKVKAGGLNFGNRTGSLISASLGLETLDNTEL